MTEVIVVGTAIGFASPWCPQSGVRGVNEERPSCGHARPSLRQDAAEMPFSTPMRNVPHWPE
jgi:hypothetical protein